MRPFNTTLCKIMIQTPVPLYGMTRFYVSVSVFPG